MQNNIISTQSMLQNSLWKSNKANYLKWEMSDQ